PYGQSFAHKLIEWLARGPRPDVQLAHYDWQRHNQNWLDFHAEVEAYARHVQTQPAVSLPPARSQKAVDVCIPYYNHGKYLPQLLRALEWQTTQEFHVIVVNDASTDDEAVRVFGQMAQEYQARGWTFVSNDENSGLSVTRNRAASMGQAEYIVFIDADNVPLPHMIERLLTAIRISGDDCLTCYLMAFDGDAPPFDVTFQNHQPVVTHATPPAWQYTPIGSSAELGLFVNTFGDANFIIRRTVFEQLGGFSLEQLHYRYITGEDYALLARLTFAGYRQDVIPEFLFYYRHGPNSLVRRTRFYENTMRVLALYRDQLRRVGLEHLIPIVYGMYQQSNLVGNQSHTNAYWVSTHVPWRVMGAAAMLKLRKNLKRLPIIGRVL
ncbi:MAG: glycosyltransferase, partial [Anaerolineae bacterium]|nr:glycosyltransferase [Anaerolineae bacterium]